MADALDEDDRHGGLPAEPHAAAKRVGHNGVNAHAGGAGERTVREDAHSDSHDTCADAGGGDGGGNGNAARLENQRIHDDDVRHGEKRRETGAQLGRNRRVALSQLKERIHNLPFSKVQDAQGARYALGTDYSVPLEPKPPVPRSVSSSSSTSTSSTAGTRWITSCAMRSPRSIWIVRSGSRFTAMILSSPR